MAAMNEKNVVLVNNSGVDIRPYENAILASLRETGDLPNELADLFSVKTLAGFNADGSDRFVLNHPNDDPYHQASYIASTVSTLAGIVKIASLTDAELARHARVAWDVNDGDTLRGCRLEAQVRGIQVH